MHADGHRHQSRDGLPKYKHLKYGDDNDDRQKITQAGKRNLSKCNQRVIKLRRNPPGQMKGVSEADILKPICSIDIANFQDRPRNRIYCR